MVRRHLHYRIVLNLLFLPIRYNGPVVTCRYGGSSLAQAELMTKKDRIAL